jgi:hypothetical protein
VNGLLVRPLSVNAVKRKLTAMVLAPKPFVVAGGFAGPDRRKHKERRRPRNEESGCYSRKKARRKADQSTGRMVGFARIVASWARAPP